jgi:ribonuclease Z
MHTTAIQAGKIAKAAAVKKLILGHYSTRYKSIEAFREEAQTQFEAVDLADDGKSFSW